MKQWIVKRSSTADTIIRRIHEGTCTTDTQVEQIARKCGDEVYWAGTISPLTDTEQMLQELGIPCSLSGFGYLVDAVAIAAENGAASCRMTSSLYPRVAKNYGKTADQVERSIRHAIETAFNRGDPEVLYKYFGNSISAEKGKATNSEFIFALARHL